MPFHPSPPAVALPAPVRHGGGMAGSTPPSWTTGTVPNSFAALPAGPLGTFGGQLMRLLNRAQQREIARLLGPLPGMDVLELGPGPGVLLGMLTRSARHVTGVEP